MGGFGLPLKVEKGRGEVLVAQLHLDEEPGFPVSDHEKIHLALLFVAKIIEALVGPPCWASMVAPSASKRIIDGGERRY